MYKRFWTFVIGVSIVASCTVNTTSLTPNSIPSADSSQFNITSVPSRQLEVSASPEVLPSCIALDLSGMPVGDDIKDSHIIYGGFQIDQTGQIWSIDTKGSRKLLLDKLPSTSFGYGIGFLENGYEFLMVQNKNILLSNLSGQLPTPVDISIVQDEIPASSPLRSIINSQSNPLVTGERFSPDGKKIVIWKPGDSSLVFKDTNSGKERSILKFDKTGYINGSWSPDGTRYVITRTRIFKGEHSQVLVVNSNGDNIQELAKFENKDLGHPYWSPDSLKVIFSISDDLNFVPYEYAVLTIATATITKYRVEAYPGASLAVDSDIIWSPDSNWILFYTRDRYLDYTGQNSSFYPNDLRALDLRTGKMYCLTQNMKILDIKFADWK